MPEALAQEHPDGCALDADGNLKDAKDISWLNSPSDEAVSLPAVQPDEAGSAPADPARPRRQRRPPLPKDVPMLTRPLPSSGSTIRKRGRHSPSPSSSAPQKAARRGSAHRRHSSPTAGESGALSDSLSLGGLEFGVGGLDLGHTSEGTSGAMSVDEADFELGLDDDDAPDGIAPADDQSSAEDLGEQRFLSMGRERNQARRDHSRHRDERSDDIRLVFGRGVYDKDGKGEKQGHWCKLCIAANGNKKKPAFFLTGSVTSCRMHVSRVPGHYEQYVAACEKNNVSPHPRAVPAAKQADTSQQTLDAFAVAAPVPHWTIEGLIDHIVQLIVEADVAPRIVDRRAFRQLLIYMRPKTADSQIPRRTTVREAILAKAEKLEDLDKGNINRIQSLISTTFDGWTSGPGNPFLSLTIHYIDAPPERPRDWVLKGQLLALEKVVGNHSGANTAAILLRLIKQYGLGQKLGWQTADNVSTNDTAIALVCRDLDRGGTVMKPKERRGRCIAHQIHLAAHHFVKGLDKVSNAALKRRLHGHPSRTMRSDGDEFDGLSEDEFIDTSMDPEDRGGGGDNPDDIEFSAGDVIGKVIAFIKQVLTSPQARAFLQKMCQEVNIPDPELRTWVRTRWASLWNCFDCVLKMKKGVDRFCALADRSEEVPPLRNKKYSDFTLSDGDWEKLTLVHRVLEEPAKAQQDLSSDTVPTVSRALPILEMLQTQWDSMLADPAYACVHAGLERGLANLRKWYRLTDETDIYFVCMILDPTIKLEYFNHEWDQEWIDTHRKRFNDTFKRYASKLSTQDSTTSSPSVAAPKQSGPSQGHYGSAAVARARQARAERERASYQAVNEIERYLNAPLEISEDNVYFDVVRWWGHHQLEYPVLATIARDYLAIQGSAVASERVFSGAAISVTKRRNRLSARMISALQRLKYAYRDGRLSAVQEAWLHLDETFDESAYETDDDD